MRDVLTTQRISQDSNHFTQHTSQHAEGEHGAEHRRQVHNAEFSPHRGKMRRATERITGEAYGGDGVVVVVVAVGW